MNNIKNNILVDGVNLSKCYRSDSEAVQALDDVSIQVKTGEMVALVGPTGSGKTTLLGILAGLELPDCGFVTLSTQPLSQLNADGMTDLRSRMVGFVYQNYNLFPSFNVRENVGLPLRLMMRPPFDAHQRSGELLADWQMSNLAHRYPAELSGGQQQLVAIARALAANPPLVIADEPTANLDSSASRQIVSRLRSLADSGEHGVILATHDLRVASQADRILNMRDGRIVKETVLDGMRFEGMKLDA